MIATLAAVVGILATHPELAVSAIGFGLAFAISTGQMAYDNFRAAGGVW